MPCEQGDFGVLDCNAETGNNPPSSAGNQSGPYLVVSNCPETMTPGSGTVTLYKGEIPLTSGTKRIRVFFWHVSTKSGTTYFNVLASMSSGTSSATDRRIDEPSSGTDLEKGICIAKVHRFGTWNSASSNVSLSTSEASIWSTSKTQNQLACMVMEFDVEVSSSVNLQIRTTASANSGVQGSWSDSVEADDNHHIRGWWPYSSIDLDCGSWDAKPPVGSHLKKIGVCETAGPEHGSSGFEHQTSGDPYGKTNYGCYGANLTYVVAVSNTGGQAYPLYAYAVSRSIGDNKAAGAIGLAYPTGYPRLGLNYLKSSDHMGFSRLTSSGGNESPISVATTDSYDL